MIDNLKYPSLCSHDFHKSLTNQVDVVCTRNPDLTHRLSQFGKFCNKCTHLLKESPREADDCIVCTDTIESYLKDRQLCQHSDRVYSEVVVKCLDRKGQTHNVDLGSMVCQQCYHKIKAALLGQQKCAVCNGAYIQLLADMQKTFISPAYTHLLNVITLLRQAKAPDEMYRKEIEWTCRADPCPAKVEKSLLPAGMAESYQQDVRPQDHYSKRYRLFPQCRKHRDQPITVCNLCLVALLNLKVCPYGCQPPATAVKTKKEVHVKHYQTGFLHCFPQIGKEECYLQLFRIKLTEERGRLDRWQASIDKIQPASKEDFQAAQKWPLYSAVVSVGDKEFIVAGGVKGKHISALQPTGIAYHVTLSTDLKSFKVEQINPMSTPRSGHSLVYDSSSKKVYAVGGFNQQQGFITAAECYSLQTKTWQKMGNLKIERSKPTVIAHQGTIYVLGGLTANMGLMECMGERLNNDTKQWETVPYEGFDFPFVTQATPTTTIPALKDHNVLLVGGSNSQHLSPLIQQLKLSPTSFDYDDRNYHSMSSVRAGCTLGMIGEDTLLCFGGTPAYENILKVEAVKLKLSKEKAEVLFVHDQLQLGSYRSVSRSDPTTRYQLIADQLHQLGFKPDLEEEQGRLVTPNNCHLLEQLWYQLGKTAVWVPL